MPGMMRSKKNHTRHTECGYGCCTNSIPKKSYRVQEKRKTERLIRAAY